MKKDKGTVIVRTPKELEAWTRIGFILWGNGWDGQGGFLILREV